MITYVNSKDAKLFEMAAEELGMAPGSLDIDTYLNSLGTLYAKSPKYVRLPLYEDGHQDEEIFEVDANARSIKIPAAFKKNGIGVVSDEFAEIVWFKINRYFDIKDFGKAAGVVNEMLNDGELHILIQWEAPDGAKGASWAYAIDKDTDPEYIYFGWAITAEHLTAKAGNIKFAIRIMQYENYGGNKIAYSFATQAAAVAVKASLSFDVTDEGIEIEAVADKVANRLMDGQIAYCPVFEEDLPALILNLENGEANLHVVANPPKKIDEESGELVNGDPYDAVAYKWYKKGINEPDFVQIDGAYKPALTVTSSGEYYVVVFGMRAIVDNKEYIYDAANDSVSAEKENFKYHTSVASSKSIICKIPAPEPLNIKKVDESLEYIKKRLLIEQDAEWIIKVDRQQIKGSVVGKVSIAMRKTANANKLSQEELDSDELVFVEVPVFNLADYVAPIRYTQEEYDAYLAEHDNEAPSWAVDDIKEAGNEPAEGAIQYEVADDTITIHMDNAAEGYYQVAIINQLNGDAETTVCGIKCRAVNPAAINEPIVIKAVDRDGADLDPSQRADGKPSVRLGDKLVAIVNMDGLVHDSLLFEWYQLVGAQDPNDLIPNMEDLLVASGNDMFEYVPEDDGSYYYVVTNIIEDKEFTKCSKSSELVVFAK